MHKWANPEAAQCNVTNWFNNVLAAKGFRLALNNSTQGEFNVLQFSLTLKTKELPNALQCLTTSA